MYLLGYDIGSSSVKASLVDAQSGLCVASGFFPGGFHTCGSSLA